MKKGLNISAKSFILAIIIIFALMAFLVVHAKKIEKPVESFESSVFDENPNVYNC